MRKHLSKHRMWKHLSKHQVRKHLSKHRVWKHLSKHQARKNLSKHRVWKHRSKHQVRKHLKKHLEQHRAQTQKSPWNLSLRLALFTCPILAGKGPWGSWWLVRIFSRVLWSHTKVAVLSTSQMKTVCSTRSQNVLNFLCVSWGHLQKQRPTQGRSPCSSCKRSQANVTARKQRSWQRTASIWRS